jgi:hypothetical protein
MAATAAATLSLGIGAPIGYAYVHDGVTAAHHSAITHEIEELGR